MSENNMVVERVSRVGLPVASVAAEQQLAEAHRLLADVYRLLEDYSPGWYPPELQEKLESVVKSRGR